MKGGTTRRQNAAPIRCYCPDPHGDTARLSDAESHHVARVLRLDVGHAVTVFDGAGREWHGTIDEVSRAGVRVRLHERIDPVAEPPVTLTLACGLLKGDAMSDVIRDATMLGAAAIVPFVSGHTAVPEEAWRARHTERWTRVAIASAKQCGRAIVPRLEPVTSLGKALDGAAGLLLMCVEPSVSGWGATDEVPPAPDAATVFVGPEGGWSAEDLRLGRDRHALALNLGPRTLRAEIAPVIALSALWTRWGWK